MKHRRVSPLLPGQNRRLSGRQVPELRKELRLAQSAFAVVCGVSIKTVESWEAGTNTPSGAASRLFQIIEKDPALVTRAGILTVS